MQKSVPPVSATAWKTIPGSLPASSGYRILIWFSTRNENIPRKTPSNAA